MAVPGISEIFLTALRLGCTSFGGPVAHLAFFREEYVGRRRWIDEAAYADLVALCQFLPGPASSQVGFGVGYLQRGLAGGVAAWVGFTLPSAVVMVALAYGIAQLGDLGHAGWLMGLKAAAVAVVAQAVWTMARTLCPDWPGALLAGANAALLVALPQAGVQVAVIAAGALIGSIWFRHAAHSSPAGRRPPSPPVGSPAKRSGAACLVVFALLLFALPAAARLADVRLIVLLDKFYRAGSLVFGGGHVVLPLLEREVVDAGWIGHDHFLAGYGAVQAAPGPLFTFSAYLGALVPGTGVPPWAGGAVALGAVFLPGLLLVAGALPFWQTLRERPAATAALRGANAAVVGLLLAALWHPIGSAGIVDLRSAGIALGAFAALVSRRVPVWAVVGLAALAGKFLA